MSPRCEMSEKRPMPKRQKRYLWIGDSGNKSRLSETDELGLGVVSGRAPFLISSTFFFTRPLRFSNLLVSIEAALLRTDFPGLASGLIIHQEDFPVPSFWTRMKRLCSDRLCRIEFWKETFESIFLGNEAPTHIKAGFLGRQIPDAWRVKCVLLFLVILMGRH